MCVGDGCYRKLKILHLLDLGGLKKLRMEKGAMPNLEVLSIRRCEALVEVPSWFQHLTNLKELFLRDMPTAFLEDLANSVIVERDELSVQMIHGLLVGGDAVIDASGFEFQCYKSGVFQGPCGTDLDHGVAAIGFGTAADGGKYWLVKNSGGTSGGEEGYIRMQRDVSPKSGLCGIAMMPSYPTA
ncbi:hypothetical protein ACLOJK_030385 [Asimina triloba]